MPFCIVQHESEIQNYPAVTDSRASNMSKTSFSIAMHSSEGEKREQQQKFCCGFGEEHGNTYVDSQSFILLKCKYSMTNSFGLQKISIL